MSHEKHSSEKPVERAVQAMDDLVANPVQDPTALGEDPLKQLKNDYNQLKDEVSEMVRQTMNSKGHTAASVASTAAEVKKVAETAARSLTDIVSERLTGGVEYARDTVNRLKDTGNDQVERVEKQVQAHPLATIAIAAGVGVIVGAYLSRRGRD